MRNNVFVLLIGKSGVGKTTIAEYLEHTQGIRQVESYTNRPRRFDGEVGHRFLSELDVEKIKTEYPDRVAETEYDGHFYFATAQQVEECDIYVINPSAVEKFKSNYHGSKVVKVVLIVDSEDNRVKHMLQRGDSIVAIEDRLTYDSVEFANARYLADFIVVNTGVEQTARAIHGAIYGWNVIAEASDAV